MKVVVITGANGGLGKALSLQFALQNYRVFMVARNLEKGRVAQKQVISLSKNPNVELLQLDLSSFISFNKFAKNMKKKLAKQKISILINNAGLLSRDQKTKQEQQMWKVNFLGTSLFTLFLLPLFKQSGRIYNIVSLTYRFGKVPSSLNKQLCSPPPSRSFFLLAYADSKLANFLFVRALSNEFRMKNKSLSIYAIDPGVINSNMISMNAWFDVLADKLFRPWLQTTEIAAQKVLAIINDTNLEKEHGELLKRKLLYQDKKTSQNKILSLPRKIHKQIKKNTTERKILLCLQDLLKSLKD